MASYNELNALIDAYINRNGVQAITGQILNGVLKAMVEQLGRGYTIMGAATPATDPGTPDGPECYFASTPGTYTDFDGLQIVPGELALLCYTPSDGWTKATIYEGFQTVQATIDGNVGTPSVGVSYANGVLSFDFHNMKGNPGQNGQDGQDGDAAGFGTIGADITGGVGTPGVTVESSGPATAKNLQFHFTNLKGETGVTSVLATVDNTTGTPTCTVSLVGQQLTLAFSGLKGAQGDTGVSADYPITIVNNLTTNDPASALSAAMGVQLEGEITQLEAKVIEKEGGSYIPVLNIEQGNISNTGEDSTSTTRIRTSNYVTADKISITTSGNKVFLRGYKGDGTYVDGLGWITTSQTVSIPGAVKYRFIFAFSNDAAIVPSDFSSLGITISAVFEGEFAGKEEFSLLEEKAEATELAVFGGDVVYSGSFPMTAGQTNQYSSGSYCSIAIPVGTYLFAIDTEYIGGDAIVYVNMGGTNVQIGTVSQVNGQNITVDPAGRTVYIWANASMSPKTGSCAFSFTKQVTGLNERVGTLEEQVEDLIDEVGISSDSVSFTGNGNTWADGAKVPVCQKRMYQVSVNPGIDMTGVDQTITGNLRFKIDGIYTDNTKISLLEINIGTTLESSYVVDIPANCEYLRIGGRCASGVVFSAGLRELGGYYNVDVNSLYYYEKKTLNNGEISQSNYRTVTRGKHYTPIDLSVSTEGFAEVYICTYDKNGNYVAASCLPYDMKARIIPAGTFYRVLIASPDQGIEETIHITAPTSAVKEQSGANVLSCGVNNYTNVESISRLGYHSTEGAPENSIPAFKESYRRGYRSLLADVRWTYDGVPVCLHDETINRVARNSDGTQISGDVYLSNLTLEQVDEYDFGIKHGSQYAGMKILRLDDFVKFCKLINAKPYIEIKDFENGGTLTQAKWSSITEIIDAYGMQNKCAFVLGRVNNYDLDAATLVHQTYPDSDINVTSLGSGDLDQDLAQWATLLGGRNELFWYFYRQNMTGGISDRVIELSNKYGIKIGFTEIETEAQLDEWLTDPNNLVCTRVAIRIKPFNEFMKDKLL